MIRRQKLPTDGGRKLKLRLKDLPAFDKGRIRDFFRANPRFGATDVLTILNNKFRFLRVHRNGAIESLSGR